jgi:hypothetical protein
MARIIQYLGTVVLLLGLITLAMGSVFIFEGVNANAKVADNLRAEKVTLGLTEAQVATGDVVDNAKEAEKAAETLVEHRHGIAPTYGDLLGSERFDPTNPAHLSYAQGINLGNSLDLAVLAFGVATATIASGAFMVLTGIALGVTGIALFGLARRTA